MQLIFKKGIILFCMGVFFTVESVSGQGVLTGLNGNDVVKSVAEKAVKERKADTVFIYQPIWLPFLDDFSSYTVYPDTALWMNKQGYVNQSFGVNPPTIGCLTLDAVDQHGKIYPHAQHTPFGADTVLSRPIRLDSIRVSLLSEALTPADSLYFSFFYQPGGGLGTPWEGLGNAPEAVDSLILEFGYQTQNLKLLYYTYVKHVFYDTMPADSLICSPCDSSLSILTDRLYLPLDTMDMPCDSVCEMEVIWNWVWSSPGMKLSQFRDSFGVYFRQVLIPITEEKYFNSHFYFRFRNIASLEADHSERQSNVDFWNIDYVRLSRNRSWSDTAINDLAIVENPSSILKRYTSMPWQHFIANPLPELKSNFDLKLSNLYNQAKNSMYQYVIEDAGANTICSYNGGNQNIAPFIPNGYQTDPVHATPPLNPINYPSTSKDSILMTVKHIFKDQGLSDINRQNDTAIYAQKFYNYFAYDDGTPESGYIVLSMTGKYTTGLALAFDLKKQDSIRAVDIYFNNVLNDAADYDFDLVLWRDNNGKPGEELYKQLVQQNVNNDIYGFQRFHLEQPIAANGTVYVGYQTYWKKFLNVGFDQNNSAVGYYFEQLNGGTWKDCFAVGSPMIRLVVGKEIPKNEIQAIESEFRFVLYPNPAIDRLFIRLDEPVTEAQNYLTSIYSVAGQQLYTAPFVEQISLSDYAPGIYILLLQNKQTGRVATAKFFITR